MSERDEIRTAWEAIGVDADTFLPEIRPCTLDRRLTNAPDPGMEGLLASQYARTFLGLTDPFAEAVAAAYVIRSRYQRGGPLPLNVSP